MTFVPLPYERQFYPYGFPLRIKSNSRQVLAAAEESWGDLQRRFTTAPLKLRCLVSESASECLPPPPVVRAQSNLFVSVADAENFCSCDLAAGFASAWVTKAVVADTEYFRYHIIEALAYSLLDSLHLVAIHAACVALQGHGVLLAGDSGAGKSSLAYACARRGWTYCSDDASSLVRLGTGRSVLGTPRAFRFRETVADLFPEFKGMEESRRGNGKPTIEVRTADLPEIRTALESRVDHIVFLNRCETTRGHAQLVPVSREEAQARLLVDPWPAELPAHEGRQTAIRRLAEAGAHEMRYRELDIAVNCLEQLVLGGSQ